MLEIFLTTLTIFLFFLPLFYFCGTFKIMKYLLFILQLTFCIIFLSDDSYYKKHVLWKEEKQSNYHNLSLYPINSIIPKYDNGTFKELDVKDHTFKYSCKKIGNFTNECLDDYFVNTEECPITDIIIEDKKTNHINYTEIKINDEKYLYFTKNNKHVKL